MMKNKLSAILAIFLAFTAMFASCSKSDDKHHVQTIVAFAQETFAIGLGNEATLTVVSTTPFANGETVSFTVSSNLVEGQDYELSADGFVFASGSREARLTVKMLKTIDDEDVFEVNLNPIAFGTLGLSRAKIGVTNADIILYSFDQADYLLTNTTEITLRLSKIVGSFTAEQDMVFEVEVDEETTAIEGVNFSFLEGKSITVPAGKNSGSIKLRLLKHEDDNSNVVLKLKQLPIVFRPGNYDKAVVNTSDATLDRLEGSWKYVRMANLAWWEVNNMGDNMKLMPVNNTDQDILTFDESGLKISLTGDLKNYFRDGQITHVREEVEVLQEIAGFPPTRVTIELIKSLVNVKFSATHTDEREAEVGYRVFDEGDKEYLEVTIRDFEPTDFLHETFNLFNQSWNTDVPKMKSMPLRFHFERVTDE